MVIEQFIKYLKFEKRYSMHTIKAYEIDLTAFQIYLNESYEINYFEVVESQHIRSWIVSLMRKGLSNATINRKIASLKSFYKYLQVHYDLIKNPTDEVVVPKIQKRLPTFVKTTEIARLLESFKDAEDYGSIRDEMVIELLYVTGMRRSELAALQYEDIDFSKEVIKVLGKRQKERLIPVSRSLCEKIQEYWLVRQENFTTSDKHLFLTAKGKPLNSTAIYNIVRKYLEGYTTVEKKSPHTLRHSFATHLLNNGAELNAIKELLGHESLAATQIYTHTTLDKLKKAYSKAHPKASN